MPFYQDRSVEVKIPSDYYRGLGFVHRANFNGSRMVQDDQISVRTTKFSVVSGPVYNWLFCLKFKLHCT